METEQFSLCWNNFHNNLRNGFHSLLLDEDLVDVTLAAEGRYLKAHKAVLSICSPYFKELFKANPCKHPIVILQDVKYSALNCLLQFMYQGEVSVSQEEIPTFMKVAETLKIKGLTEHTAPSDDKNGISDNSVCSGSPYPYENLDQRQLRRTRPAKKLIRPLQPLRTLDGAKTVKSPQSLTPPPSVSSPQLPPAKKPCTENIKERVSHYADHAVVPKEEPVDHSSVDDYKDSYREDASSEHSQTSGTWVPDIKVPPDVSSPEVLEKLNQQMGYMQQAINHLIQSNTELERKLILLSQKDDDISTIEEENDCYVQLLGALPFGDLETFKLFDEKLKESKSLQRKVIQMLKNCGGKNAKCATINFMKRIMNDELAMKFSLKGRLTKASFVETNIFCIIESLIGTLFKTIEEIEASKDAMGDWLSQAKTRLFRRAAKADKQVASVDDVY